MKLSWLVMVMSAIADSIMTVYSISLFGIEIEGNPVLKYIMECVGPLAGISLCKIVGIAIVTYVVNTMPDDYSIGGRYIKNKWFYYLASIVWFYGAFSHIIAILMN